MEKRALSSDYMGLKSNLVINCEKCSGLCCVALYFNKTDGFPENKQAGKACINLKEDYTCKVYEQLESKKLKGCIAYDCFGAGQKVTHEWKSYGEWSSNQCNKFNIFNSFEINRLLNQIMWYLIEAYSICDRSNVETINQLIQENIELTKLNPSTLITLNLDNYRNRVNEQLKQITIQLSNLSSKKINDKLQFGKDYSNQDLNYMDFTMSYLIGSNLQNSKLKYTNFLGTDLRDVNVCNTDLSESLFLTQFQVNSMIGNSNTKLPTGMNYPKHWAKL